MELAMKIKCEFLTYITITIKKKTQIKKET